MRSIRFSLLGLVCALILASPAFADCKKCSGQYCESVDDLAYGRDHCDISTSWETTLCSPPGATVCTKWTTTCNPAGDECTNLHDSVTVSGGGVTGEINTLNDLTCASGYGSYWDCG